MEFRILGPLEVVSDGRPVELGGQQQRALLVALLLEANRVVSADRLIEALWETSPPPTALKAVQVHVSQLRKVLGRERLRTQAPGYVLEVETDELDLSRFEQLWAQGRLQEGLGLWRGPPLPEFVFHGFAQTEIARLEERRIVCLEERVEADLAVGRHGALVAELERLVREQPLREGLRSQLMLALYRSGRQAEALQSYQDGRRVLVEELGIEPGRPLRELHRRILEQDPALDLPGAAAEVPTREAPSVTVIAESDEEAAGYVRKTVTVVSVQVVTPTSDGEGLDPEAQRLVVGRAFGEVESAVSRHGGTIESVTGDALTAAFGLPAAHEDDGLRGIRAASELSGRLAGLEIEFRVGISTGRVVTGSADHGPQPRATGRPLTLSARLGEAAEPGEIRFDDATWRLVRAAVTCERADDAWRLLASSESELSSGRLGSPMVGRDRPRRRLHDAFDQAAGDRSCQLFTVLGLAGVGKSRLVQEFLRDLGERAVVATGRCLPYGDGITYWPLLDAIKEAVGLEDSETRERGREKLLGAFADDAGATVLADRVARMVGLAEGESSVEEGFLAVRALFETLARTGPLVLVFDDIHWGESTFLDLIEDIAEWSRDAPILLVCMARPELLELRPGWGGGKQNATTTLLEPLSSDDCSRLIDNLVGDAGLPSEVGVKIVEAAEGNPLFVEEMLFMLIEDGLLVRRRGRWSVAGDLESVRVPPTIEALLATRLDQLETVERAVIERAAVAGKVFYESAIVELAPESLRPEVERSLRSLVRKELIRPEPGTLGGRSYRFRHLLIRDAAYDAIAKQSRAQLHERFGSWLERVAGDRATEYEEVVGYHLEQAYLCLVELGLADDAAHTLAREAARRLGSSGRRAFTLSDPTAGIKLISRAVALLPADDPLRVELVPNVRAVQAVNRNLVWADRVLTEAVEAAATSGDRLLAGRALVQRGLLRLFTESGVTADELMDAANRSIAVFEEFGDELGLARAWRLKGQAHYLARRAGACGDASERALEHARHAADRFEEREIIEWLVIALLLGPAPIAEALQRCESLLEEISADELLRAEILGSMSALVTMLHGPDEAQDYAAQSRAMMDGLGKQVWIVAYWRSFVFMAQHDPVAAEQELRPAYDALKQLGEKSHFSTVTHALGTALYLQGRLEEADQMTRECEEVCRPNDVHSGVLWRSTRAKVLARLGSVDEGERLAHEAVAIAASSDFHLAHADASMDLAEVLTLAGKTEAAAASVEEAARFYALKGVRQALDGRWRDWLGDH